MFHLPREIIQLIFEFDPTYKEEYKKVLQILNNFPSYYKNFPTYYKHENTLVGKPYIYIFKFNDLQQYPVTHYYPPSKYYFYLLRSN